MQDCRLLRCKGGCMKGFKIPHWCYCPNTAITCFMVILCKIKFISSLHNIVVSLTYNGKGIHNTCDTHVCNRQIDNEEITHSP